MVTTLPLCINMNLIEDRVVYGRVLRLKGSNYSCEIYKSQ